METDPAMCWRYLRSTRADPPPLVSAGARVRVFGASLEQAEQLWQASAALHPIARPIVLYYCLTQAGRAILASRAKGNEWRALPSHGLTPCSPTPPASQAPSLASYSVCDSGKGFFQQIVKLLGSPSLPKPVSLAALVSSVPQAESFIGTSLDPGPLSIEGYEDFDARRNGRVAAWLGPLPSDLVPQSGVLNLTDRELLPTAEQLRRWLAPYPAVFADTSVAPVQVVLPGLGFSHASVKLTWLVMEGSSLEYSQELGKLHELISYPERGLWEKSRKGWVLPLMPGNGAPCHPLATWWSILYAMSMLARYSPDYWTRLLDPDKSRDSERVRHVLDTALTYLPWLVLLEVADANSSRRSSGASP